MIIISHRGVSNGKDKNLENKPIVVEQRIAEGFNVEIDFWCEGDKFYLGHDYPDYEININWLVKFSNFLWIHCKNAQSLSYLNSLKNDKLNYFYHENDPYTITSKGNIWCYPGSEIINDSVYLFPENYPINQEIVKNFNLNICTDYPNRYKNLFSYHKN